MSCTWASTLLYAAGCLTIAPFPVAAVSEHGKVRVLRDLSHWEVTDVCRGSLKVEGASGNNDPKVNHQGPMVNSDPAAAMCQGEVPVQWVNGDGQGTP